MIALINPQIFLTLLNWMIAYDNPKHFPQVPYMDVDKILPFSSTLGDGIALNKVKGEVQTRKGLRWIPRHPETRKGVVSDEMLRGVENKRRSGDSRIG